MNAKKAAVVQISIALAFAVAMIVARRLFGKDSIDENLWIAVWWVPFSLLAAGSSTCGGKQSRRQ